MRKILLLIGLLTFFLSSCGSTLEITVNFETNGGSQVPSQVFNEESEFTLPNSPTKENFIFVGWFLDENLETPFSVAGILKLEPKDSITVYAKWEYDPEIVGSSPVYQGMDVSSVSNTQASFPLSYKNNSITTITSGIDDEIPTIDIPEQPDLTYYANPNEEIFVSIFLTNPDSQVILRFKLNGVIYQSFEFQEGSSSELLIVKVNAGEISGIKELTIDEIKYVENVSNIIKDAEFEGNRTIQMGVTYQHPIEAFIVSEVITSTSYTLTMTITDTDDLMNVYENPMVFYLFDGVSIIYTQSLNVEYNTIEFSYLNPSKTYEYAIASTYDLLDGYSSRSFIAAQARFTTKDIVTIDSVFPLQDSISFELTINDDREVGFLSAIELYQNETLMESLTDLNVRTFENLQSNIEYTIKVTYSYDLNEGSGQKNIEYITNITIAAFNISYYSVSDVDYDSQNYIILNPGESITNIFINQNYSSILTSNNRVLMWGNNDLGQLGDGSNTNRTIPIDITDSFNLDDGDYIKQISMGPFSASAISSKGRLFTWGDTNNSPEEITYLFNLETDEIITSVFLNIYKNLVFTSDGRIFEWDLFKLIKTRDITNLFNLDEGETIVKTVSGGLHYLFLTSKGKIMTLGENLYGQLGNGSTVSSEIPLDITNQFDFSEDEVIVDISTGSYHSMSITSSNRVFTWGENMYGQLGNGTFEHSNVPLDITNNFTLSEEEIITKIFAGGGSSFVITSEDQIFTWGMKFADGGGVILLGFINFPQTFNEEFTLASDEKIVDLYSSGNSFIAYTTNQEYLVWGKNDFGQIAIGSFSIFESPQELPIFNAEFLDEVEYYFNETIREYIPTKEGYIFDGWYTDLTFTTQYVFNTMPAEDLVLYAKWIKNE